MKVFVLALLVAGAMAAPGTNPYTWRPAQPIDMNKVVSVNPKVDPVKQFNNPNRLRPLTTPKDYQPLPRQTECGMENTKEGRIVQGSEAEPNQFPWLAVVLIGGSGLCTGSLVHPNWVLTAGHCVTANSYTIQLGSHDRSNPAASGGIEIDTTESYQHVDYNPVILSGDMGLIRLPKPAPLSDIIALSCLPTRSDVGNDYEGELTTITGWGKVHDTGAASSTLQFARDRPVIANDECRTYYPLNVLDTTICTSTEGKIGTCNGDSGGPLNLQRGAGNPYLQIGVTSYVSSQGCESGNPDGFSRVTEYLDWLETTSGGDIVIED